METPPGSGRWASLHFPARATASRAHGSAPSTSSSVSPSIVPSSVGVFSSWKMSATQVPPFGHTFRGEMSLSDWGAEGLLLGDGGEVLATIESYGGGTVIQLAEADMLDNRAVG